MNAADALVVAQTAIGLLRQQLRPTDRVHGIVTKGGDAVNVIPAQTSASYGVRASVLDDLVDVRDKVFRCFEAGALATGATLTISGGDRPYAEGRWDPELSARVRAERRGARPRLRGRADARPPPTWATSRTSSRPSTR